MKNPSLFIFPYNGNGLEALGCIGDSHDFIGFVDDTLSKQGKNAFGQIVYSREILMQNQNAKVLAVPGSPSSYIKRKEIIDALNVNESRYATLIHPMSFISPMAKVGKNVLIMAGVVITSNAVIEDHVCILPNTVIHHDVTIGKYSLLGSNISVAGGTAIGENCYIGSGTKIINQVTIGEGSLIGLGSNVIKSVPANSKAVGNPARLI